MGSHWGFEIPSFPSALPLLISPPPFHFTTPQGNTVWAIGQLRKKSALRDVCKSNWALSGTTMRSNQGWEFNHRFSDGIIHFFVIKGLIDSILIPSIFFKDRSCRSLKRSKIKGSYLIFWHKKRGKLWKTYKNTFFIKSIIFYDQNIDSILIMIESIFFKDQYDRFDHSRSFSKIGVIATISDNLFKDRQDWFDHGQSFL